MRSLPEPSGLRDDVRGAVYVEFLIAFMPVFVFFLCLLQLALLFSAKLMVEHAAVNGARAAAVVFGDEPEPYGETTSDTNKMTAKRTRTVRNAVLLSMAPLIVNGSAVSVDVLFPNHPGGEGRPEGTTLPPMTLHGTQMMRVRVEAQIVCKISIANAIVCSGFKNGVRDFVGFDRLMIVRSESIFPYQGARYDYESR